MVVNDDLESGFQATSDGDQPVAQLFGRPSPHAIVSEEEVKDGVVARARVALERESNVVYLRERGPVLSCEPQRER